MKQLVIALGVLFAAGTAFAQQAESGAQLYQSKCASCHGKDGKGTSVGKKMGAGDLAAASSKSDAELTKIISDGQKKMPAYKGTLTAEQIQELVKYIKGGLK